MTKNGELDLTGASAVELAAHLLKDKNICRVSENGDLVVFKF